MPALPPERPGCPNAPGGRRPLPDPRAVRLCLIPDPAPPYDAEVAQSTRPPGREVAARASGPPGRPPGEHTGDDRRTEDARATADRGHPGRPAEPSVSPQPVSPGWPSRFAQVLAETLAGSRPPGQMVPWTTEMARSHIQRLGPQLASVQRPRVRRVVTFHPTSDVMEMTVVVGFGARVRALAVRLERAGPHPDAAGRQSQPPRWLCTAVEAA